VNKRIQLITGIVMMVFGIVLISLPLVGLVPKVQTAAAGSLFDRINMAGRFEQELKPGEYITIVDEKTGVAIDQTSRVIYIGDELINESNDQYRVTRVRGNKAYARKSGKAPGIVYREEWDTIPAGAGTQEVQADMSKTQVALYHTHSGESYVPTDGAENIPAKGGIFKVGDALADTFRKQGINVVDDKTPHEPHDANAYHRSRRTAVQLLKKNPAVLFDVHRDGIPDPDFYNKEIQGEEITKIRLVVGRQNPKMSTNLEFAKNIKAFMDKHKPGLIKGIFIGKGNYNQDLGPRALLLEVGTHTNDRTRAENGAAVFASVFPRLMDLKPAGPQGGIDLPGGTPGEGMRSWSTLGWIIGVILVAGAAFLFISTGSIQGMKSKLGELKKTEFASFFGPRKIKGEKRKKHND